jgi:hypothetical protein
VNVPGQAGSNGRVVSSTAILEGHGGCSGGGFGSGAKALVTAGTGNAGSLYGGGGGGAFGANSTQTGGAGAGGCVIVTTYY